MLPGLKSVVMYNSEPERQAGAQRYRYVAASKQDNDKNAQRRPMSSVRSAESLGVLRVVVGAASIVTQERDTRCRKCRMYRQAPRRRKTRAARR